MLTLTPTAADAVRALVAGTEVDDETGGLRIASGDLTTQGTSLELSLVNGPETTDNEVEAGGAHVFLEPAVAEILDDKVLDAQVDSGRVQFTLFDQPSSGADGRPSA
jgi:Fe-S cluster assembly iron-binding protein IscA